MFACITGKANRQPFTDSGKIKYRPLDLIGTGTTRPITQPDKLGNKYLQIFVDAATGWATGHAMNTRSQAGAIIASTILAIQARAGEIVKRLHSGNAKKQDTKELRKVLQGQGTEHTKTSPHSSQQNAVV